MALYAASSSSFKNRILQVLSAKDRDRLLPQLEPVELVQKQVLHAAAEPISHVYFVEAGVVSLLTPLESGQEVEVGLIDRRGVVGLAVVMGADVAATEAMVQVAGHALRLPAAALRDAAAQSHTLRTLLLRYMQVLHIQVSQTAACNAQHNLDERLARWLLMVHDCVDGGDLPATHELIAKMLSVRRSGVTVALGTLERTGAIRSGRGSVKVVDREQLEESACECYATVLRLMLPLLAER